MCEHALAKSKTSYNESTAMFKTMNSKKKTKGNLAYN